LNHLLSKVDDLTPEQRRQLLEQLLREKEKRNAEQGLERGRAHELFSQRARVQPNSKALICNRTTVTYGELEERANRVAHALRASELAAGSVIAIAVEHSVNLVAGILGSLKAACVCFPVNLSDPQSTSKTRFSQRMRPPSSPMIRNGSRSVTSEQFP
jgi:acyl-CoA synthetase (AMP-forming)/AMP-acid ligase II